jgi:hypothetical protein
MRIFVVAVCSVVFFFPTYWLFHSVVGPNWGAGIAAVGMYLVFPVLALRLWREPAVLPIESMEVALESGLLRSEEFQIASAIEVEESEDEGRHFFLAIAPDRTLFLSGQYLYAGAGSGRFPSTRIRVYWHATLGLTYGVECLGMPLTVTRKAPPFPAGVFDSNDVPADRHVFPQPIDEAAAGVFRPS